MRHGGLVNFRGMRMRKGLFVLFVLLGMLEGMAQEPWSLKLELVNPTGKLDNRSYFLATLKNESDMVSYWIQKIVPRPDNKGYHSTLFSIYDLGGDTCQFRDACFFDFNDTLCYLIEPKEELKVRLYLCASPVELLNGVMPYNSVLARKIKRVRIMIEDLYFLPLSPSISWTIKQGLQHVNVYSNWLEIDGEEFYRTFRGGKMSSD